MPPLSGDRLALLRAVLAEKGLVSPHAAPLPRRPDVRRARLSTGQERLFFLELYEPGTVLYNDTVRVTIEGELDVEGLRRAAARVAERHEILRTTFVLGSDGPEQRIHPPRPVAVRLVELAEEAETAESLALAEARKPFDLEGAPPWRLTLARVGPREWSLILTMHHILSDGASMGLFFDELTCLYAERDVGVLDAQFGDWAEWERAREAPQREEEDTAYWQETLAGPIPTCAWTEPRGRTTGRGGHVPLAFPPATVTGLETLGRQHQATPNQILLTAWFALLGAQTQLVDLCTGTASSLRQRRELEPLLGFFVQSLLLRVDLGGDPTFPVLLQRVRDSALAAQAHAALPFDRILRAAGHANGGQETSLPQTFFSHMKDAIRAPVFPGTQSSWEFVDPGVARFELSLVLHESKRELTGFLEYDAGVLGAAAARRMGDDYVQLVCAVLDRPERRLSELQAQRARPVRRITRTPVPSRPRVSGEER